MSVFGPHSYATQNDPKKMTSPARVIYLLNDPANLQMAIQLQPEIAIATTSWYMQHALQAAKREVIQINELVERGMMKEVETFFYGIAGNWYKTGGVDFTRIRGVSLGLAYEHYCLKCNTYQTEWMWATLGIAPFAWAITCFKELIERHRPSEIWSDLPECAVLDGLKTLARHYKIELNCTSLRKTEQASVRPGRDSASLKHRLMEGIFPYTSWARRMIAIAHTTLGRLRGEKRIPVATLSYASVSKLSDAMRKHQLLPIPAAPWYLAPRPIERLGKAWENDYQKLRTTWQSLRQDPAYLRQFIFMNIDCSDFYVRFFDAIINNQFKEGTYHLKRLLRFFRRMNIQAVLTPFDEPTPARLMILAAQSVGIPSIVVQHGIMALSQARCNHRELTTADYAFVFSDSDARNLKQRCPAARPRVVGAPQFKQVSASGMRDAPEPAGSRKIQILILPPTAGILPESTMDLGYFMARVVEALNAFSDRIEVAIKIHPADSLSHHEPAMKLMSPNFPYTFHDSGSIITYLDRCDVVISCVSTSVGEALVMCRPVIFIPPPYECIPDAFLPGGGLPQATSAQELIDCLEPAINHLARYRAGYDFKTHLQYYGPLDGRTSERIAEQLADILTAI